MAAIRYLAELTYEECANIVKAKPVILLPLGPLEAHGPHLPLGVDIQGAVILAELGAQQLTARGIETVIAPVIPYTLAQVAMPFPGTVTLRRETVIALLLDIAASFKQHGFQRLVIVCHHLERANLAALQEAAGEISNSGLSVLVSGAIEHCFARNNPSLLKGEHPLWDFHAGEAETAFYLWKYPQLVKEAIRVNLPPVWSDIRQKFLEGARNFFEAGAPSCYLGDPAQATAELGRRLYSILAQALAEEVEDWLRGL